ncbi:hypothetical protein KR074_012078 [Drosophila pseudoananassae]|nr:hypothetical protein KR074_012078 [Drosophila pseudoananassae]
MEEWYKKGERSLKKAGQHFFSWVSTEAPAGGQSSAEQSTVELSSAGPSSPTSNGSAEPNTTVWGICKLLNLLLAKRECVEVKKEKKTLVELMEKIEGLCNKYPDADQGELLKDEIMELLD